MYCRFKWKKIRKTEAYGFILNQFSVCSSYKWKFIVCPFDDEETNRSYLFANGLNGQNLLAYCIYACSLLTVHAGVCCYVLCFLC
jgi:hypothetical protein